MYSRCIGSARIVDPARPGESAAFRKIFTNSPNLTYYFRFRTTDSGEKGLGVTMSDGHTRHFCVVVHDVAPRWRPEVDQILVRLRPLVGQCVGGAIVPSWHGRHPCEADALQFRNWSMHFGEYLLHGWTHQRDCRPGIVSWLTGQSDEFAGLTAEESQQRVEQGQALVTAILGNRLRGFVAPAWQLPGGIAAIQSAGIEYCLGYFQLSRAAAAPIRLTTWSWDWGWLPVAGYVGAFLGELRRAWQKSALPVVVLHPMDVRRGHINAACRVIQRLIDQGWNPALPCEVAGCEPVSNRTVSACKD